MHGFFVIPNAAGWSIASEVPDDRLTYAHPAQPLVEAQRLAWEGAAPVAMVIIDVPEGYAACCETCFRASPGTHAPECPAEGAVMAYEAVLRPVGEVR